MGSLFNMVAASGAAPTIDWGTIITADSFAGMLTGVTTVLTVVVPVALVVAGIPVVWKLVKRFMRG